MALTRFLEDAIYRLIVRGSYSEDHKASVERLKNFIRMGSHPEIIATDRDIIGKAVQKRKLDAILYRVWENSRLENCGNFLEEYSDKVENRLSELMKSLDRKLNFRLDVVNLSYQDLHTDAHEALKRYDPSSPMLTPGKIQELHEKIEQYVENWCDDRLLEKHERGDVVKIASFEVQLINGLGGSVSRRDGHRVIRDYCVCFIPYRDWEAEHYSHETGHKLGLMHVEDPYDIMYPAMTRCIWFIPPKFREGSRLQWKIIKKVYS